MFERVVSCCGKDVFHGSGLDIISVSKCFSRKTESRKIEEEKTTIETNATGDNSNNVDNTGLLQIEAENRKSTCR